MLKAAAIIGGFNLGGFLLTTGIKSEVVTDLLGTGSIGLSALALASSASSPRLVVACTAIGVWSLRLSSFLAYRAFLNGDARFKPFFPPVVDGKKGNWADYPDRLGKLAGFWGLQALWGFVMLCPLLLRHTSVPVWYGWPGIALAAVGFAIEAVADQQKFNYKNNSNELMTSGLFSVVRYPQYSGEILFWTGLGWYWSASLPLSLLPVAFLPAAFVTLLLTKVSGIPMTEKSRAKRFANDQKYADYVKRTSKLIPGIY